MRPTGVIEPNPAKEAIIPGAIVSPVEGGVINWPPPAYSPETGLFYVQEHNGFNILYLTEPDPRGSMGLGGKTRGGLGSAATSSSAIDPMSGKAKWRHEFPGGGGGGLLATAGDVLFSGRRQRQLRRRSMRPTASRCGTRASATSRTRRRPTWSTAASTCSSPSATRCTRSRCTDGIQTGRRNGSPRPFNRDDEDELDLAAAKLDGRTLHTLPTPIVADGREFGAATDPGRRRTTSDDHYWIARFGRNQETIKSSLRRRLRARPIRRTCLRHGRR